jgi:hypothetical protein
MKDKDVFRSLIILQYTLVKLFYTSSFSLIFDTSSVLAINQSYLDPRQADIFPLLTGGKRERRRKRRRREWRKRRRRRMERRS